MYRLLLFLVLIAGYGNNLFAAKRVHSKQYKFSIVLPETMTAIKDTSELVVSDLYYDTANNVVLMISKRESKFRSVEEYMDCTRETLELDLKYMFGDSLLQLVSCTRPDYYPPKATALKFSVSILPMGYDSYIIYFIHHKHTDLQLSFTYKRADRAAEQYIHEIMKTLKLKK